MPVHVTTGGPVGQVAMEIRGGVLAPPPPPPVTATRPLFGSSQEDGVTGFERLEDVIVHRNLEGRRVFWSTVADDPRTQCASDKAAGRLVLASHKAPSNIMSIEEAARPALFNTHRTNVINYGDLMLWSIHHEPENDGMAGGAAEFRARYMAYWRCMKGLNHLGEQITTPVTNALIGPIFMAVTEKSANRQEWRDLIDPDLDPLPMDFLGVDGYNPLNRRSFSNLFTWWGQQAVALGVPWVIPETGTHGTPTERESWLNGMDVFTRKPDASSQSLKAIFWFDSHEGQNAAEIGWRLEDAFADGWTIVNNRATGTRVEDLLSPARVKLYMDSYPARTWVEEPPPEPIPDLDAGPLALGAAEYPYPANAVFVSLNAPDTNLGTETSPVGSLTRAAALAPNPGVIVYREGVYTNVSNVNLPNKTLTIQNYPGEVVWWDGSDPITGWVIDPDNASRYRRPNWTTVLNRDLPDPTLVDDHPEAAYPESLWRNGVILEQVNALADVTGTVTEAGAAGRFYFDTVTHRLYVAGVDPRAPAETRITVRQVACTEHQTGKPGLTLRGFGIRRYGTSPNQYGAVRAFGEGHTWENMHAVECSNSAVFVQSTSGLSLQHNLFDGMGQMGARAYRVTSIDAGYNIVRRCNRKRFNTAGAAGGFKFDNECHAGLIHHNFAELNYGHNFWFDEHSGYAACIANRVDGQSEDGAGIFLELGAGQVAAGNWIQGCTHGVLVSESDGNILVANNTTVDCTNHVRVQRGSRENPTGSGFRVVNHLASEANNDGNLLVSYHDTIGNGRDYLEGDWHISDTRAWRKTPGASPYARVTMPGNTLSSFSTQADLATATGEEGGSAYTDNVATDPYLEADRQTPKSPCIGTGTPIPANIADLLGWDDATRATPNIGAY